MMKNNYPDTFIDLFWLRLFYLHFILVQKKKKKELQSQNNSKDSEQP